jgi:hypothetical protein
VGVIKMSEFTHNGITSKTEWISGRHCTTFSKNGDVLKTVERIGSFGDEDTKAIIKKQILPFL